MDKNLVISEWINLAKQRGIVLSIDNIMDYPLNQIFYIAPLEYTRFTYGEYPEKNPDIKPNTAYTPTMFFKPMKLSIKRISDPYTEEVSRINGKHKEPNIDVLIYPGKGEKPWTSQLSEEKDYPFLTHGSGDGFTSYVLWDKIKTMPKVYYKPFYN
jgi:hypothetical protein